MARLIFREQLPSDMVEEQENKSTSATDISFDEEEISISASELESLMRQWDAAGRSNLSINEGLAQRIEAYLEYHKRIEPLKKELAKMVYEPFICDNSSCTGKHAVTLYVNDEEVCKLRDAYFYANTRAYTEILDLADFKRVALALKNINAIYIDETLDETVDLAAYVLSIGGTISQDYDADKFFITLPENYS